MTARAPSSLRRHARGFTLIELLTVIAIIGILTAITIPVVGGVRDAAKKTKTKVQFTQWTAAIRSFKSDYGYYPRFQGTTAAGNHRVNGRLTATGTSMAGNDYLFQELLSGKPAKPKAGGGFDFESNEKPITESGNPQNKKRIELVKFDISELVPIGTGTTKDNALQDAFGNVEIAVIVDLNGDGFINANDLISGTQFPALDAFEGRGTLTSNTVRDRILASDPNQNGVRAEVIFYSPGKGNRSGGNVSESDAVWSW